VLERGNNMPAKLIRIGKEEQMRGGRVDATDTAQVVFLKHM